MLRDGRETERLAFFTYKRCIPGRYLYPLQMLLAKWLVHECSNDYGMQWRQELRESWT